MPTNHSKSETEKPEIFAIHKNKDGKSVTRRGFISLGTGIAAGATAGAMISCSDPVSSEKTSQSVCKKTVQLSHSDIVNAVACSPGGSLMAVCQER